MNQDELDDMMKLQLKLYQDMKTKWDELGIDAVIMPNHPIPTFRASNVNKVGILRDYQTVWSVLHYPAGVVPLLLSDQSKGDLKYEDTYNDMWTKGIKEDLATANGLPVGVQVISRKWDDEVALGVMKAIDESVFEGDDVRTRIRPEIA